MSKRIPRSKTKGKLSAEALSLTTKKAISTFLGSNPKVTSLPDSTVVTSQNEIDNHLLGKGAKGPPAEKSRSDQKDRRASSFDEKEIAKAVKEIGGILASLPKNARFAVLKKVCGAFGFKPKGSAQEIPTKPKETKSSFNEKFSQKTIAGQLLEASSGWMRKLAKSTSEKPSKALHAVHRALLKSKSEIRAKEVFPEEVIPEGFNPGAQLQQLVGAVGSAIDFATANHPNLPEQQLADAGWCLFQGNLGDLEPPFQGIIPDPEAWLQAHLSVPRTEQEAEARSSQLLASKKQRKEKRQKEKENPEDQGPDDPPAKRVRPTTRQTSKASEGKDTSDLDMVESDE